ncbi:MAG: OmpA family protein [Myxococcota bacterium]
MNRKFAVRWTLVSALAMTAALGMTACPKKPPVTDSVDAPKPVELTLYRVSPTEGPTDKVTAITLTGTGINEGAKAFIGDVQVIGTSRASGETLRGTVPGGLPAGTYNVTVRNPDGKEAVLQRGFTIKEPAPVGNNEPKPADCSLKDIFFDFDASSLNDEARGILQENATCLKAKKIGRVQVEGHADERGSTDYNLALGQRRADEVKRYLSTLGIANVSTISYGEERPAEQGSDEGIWAKNRRAVVVPQ